MREKNEDDPKKMGKKKWRQPQMKNEDDQKKMKKMKTTSKKWKKWRRP